MHQPSSTPPSSSMENSRSASMKRNKFFRIITLPIRALGKARDLYVRSMNGYAASSGCYGGGGFGASAAEPLPRSFSAASARSAEDDFSELIKAASARDYAGKLDLDDLKDQIDVQQKKKKKAARIDRSQAKGVVPRSASVGMVKIDEDQACEFDDESLKDFGTRKHGSGLFGRSRSYAVTSTTVVHRF